jgi:hypothetical protein
LQRLCSSQPVLTQLKCLSHVSNSFKVLDYALLGVKHVIHSGYHLSVDFHLEQARPQAPLEQLPFHQWVFSNGAEWTGFYRLGQNFLLRFPALADFEVSADGLTVRCWPAPDISENTLEHLYLNQVLPLALSKRGKQVFHASAIETPAGAVAFMAASGRGKSTLAASFATSGFRFLTDDALLLEEVAGGYTVLPSHPSIRLWDDSRDELIGAEARQAPAVQYTPKARILYGDSMAFCTQAQPLRRVYFLGDGSATELTIKPMPPSLALISLLKNTFLLDIEAPQTLATHFDQLNSMVALPIYYELDYPRRYAELPRVREGIIRHAAEG